MPVIYVLDYGAAGKTTTPRMLHRTDCPHPYPDHPPWRKATREELRTLPQCHDCARKELNG